MTNFTFPSGCSSAGRLVPSPIPQPGPPAARRSVAPRNRAGQSTRPPPPTAKHTTDRRPTTDDVRSSAYTHTTALPLFSFRASHVFCHRAYNTARVPNRRRNLSRWAATQVKSPPRTSKSCFPYLHDPCAQRRRFHAPPLCTP